MAIRQRQNFLLKLLTDDALRKKFYSGKNYNFGLTKTDLELIRAIDKDGVIRKAEGLKRKLARRSVTEGDN